MDNKMIAFVPALPKDLKEENIIGFSMSYLRYSKFKESLYSELLNQNIWHYYSLDKFLSLIINSELYLCKASGLFDQFEGANGKWAYQIRNLINNKNQEQEQEQEYKNIIKRNRENTYLSCWFLNDHEDYTMWNTYSSIDKGFAVRTTVNSLLNSLTFDNDLMFAGKVIYKDLLNDMFRVINKGEDDHSEYFVKDIRYKSENEFRIFVHDKTNNIENVKIPIELGKLEFSIVTSPKMSEWLFDTIYKMLADYQLETYLHKSEMRSHPYYLKSLI